MSRQIEAFAWEVLVSAANANTALESCDADGANAEFKVLLLKMEKWFHDLNAAILFDLHCIFVEQLSNSANFELMIK